jgi:hypothetical protein
MSVAVDVKHVDGGVEVKTVDSILAEFARLLGMLLGKLIVSQTLHAGFTMNMQEYRRFRDEFVFIASPVLAETHFDSSRFNSEGPGSSSALFVEVYVFYVPYFEAKLNGKLWEVMELRESHTSGRCIVVC